MSAAIYDKVNGSMERRISPNWSPWPENPADQLLSTSALQRTLGGHDGPMSSVTLYGLIALSNRPARRARA
jgi:hypothetical protein